MFLWLKTTVLFLKWGLLLLKVVNEWFTSPGRLILKVFIGWLFYNDNQLKIFLLGPLTKTVLWSLDAVAKKKKQTIQSFPGPWLYDLFLHMEDETLKATMPSNGTELRFLKWNNTILRGKLMGTRHGFIISILTRKAWVNLLKPHFLFFFFLF